MLGLILLPIMNIALFLGMYEGHENVLNVAIFIMWVLAIIHFMAMFQSNTDLLKNPYSKGFRILMRVLIFITIIHSVYWGYFFVPAMWTVAVLVLWARRWELERSFNRGY